MNGCTHIWRKHTSVSDTIKTVSSCTICGTRRIENPPTKEEARAVLIRGRMKAISNRHRTGKIEAKRSWAIR